MQIDDPFLPMASRTLENINQLVLDTRRMHGVIGVEQPNSLGVTDTSAADCASPTDDHANMEPNSHVYPDELHIVEELALFIQFFLYVLFSKVMLRCIHLMATDNPKCRVLSMAVLVEGCLTLRDEQDLLLPLVHKIWSSLLARFRDRSAVVVEKAFQILLVLSNVAGDFLRSRATSDVMPSLLTFLKRGLAVSANASESYRHLTSYRVQRELLARLGSFSADLNLGSEALYPVVQLCVLYLASNQPPGLREVALRSLKVIWPLDPGLILFEFLSQSTHLNPASVLLAPSNTLRLSKIEVSFSLYSKSFLCTSVMFVLFDVCDENILLLCLDTQVLTNFTKTLGAQLGIVVGCNDSGR
ncbi:hypothetical protein FBUS_06748 [Fasciolopsis buskii]|uniref:TTI1 C-terminal TPR domain-containing protein n=1 Tax=Fasciolopsis buskii TaxID=27845 RepID=A0A8E0VG88_9TREM|nr:hypothetical protein FBUS_06748 [Fasciolopsis buski]